MIGSGTVDDGYIAGIVRSRGDRGLVGNVYRWLNAPEAPFSWFYEPYHWWSTISAGDAVDAAAGDLARVAVLVPGLTAAAAAAGQDRTGTGRSSQVDAVDRRPGLRHLVGAAGSGPAARAVGGGRHGADLPGGGAGRGHPSGAAARRRADRRGRHHRGAGRARRHRAGARRRCPAPARAAAAHRPAPPGRRAVQCRSRSAARGRVPGCGVVGPAADGRRPGRERRSPRPCGCGGGSAAGCRGTRSSSATRCCSTPGDVQGAIGRRAAVLRHPAGRRGPGLDAWPDGDAPGSPRARRAGCW